MPDGTRWASIFSGVLIQAKITCPNQRGKASTTVKLKWLEAVKIYGKRPKKLFKAIKINKFRHKKVPPGVKWCPVMAANSEPTKRITNRNKVIICLWYSQNTFGSISNTRIAASQFKGSPKSEIGSKMENKLDIFYKMKFN